MLQKKNHTPVTSRNNAGNLSGNKAARGFPAIQRAVNYDDTEDLKNQNLAQTVIRFLDFGTTHTHFNGTKVNSGNAGALINGPDFNQENLEAGVKLSVGSDPTNTWKCTVDLPTDPPWEMQTTIANINEAVRGMRNSYPQYPKPVDGATQVGLTVKGSPSDGSFANKVRVHEYRHVADNREVSEAMLEPWDRRITDFRTQNRSVQGDDNELAKTAFYQDIGSSPAEMGTGLYRELVRKGRAFHQEDEGKMPEVDRMLYNYSTKHFILYLKHSH